VVPDGGLASALEAVFSGGAADEVHGHVFDGGHVFRFVVGSKAHQVVVEVDVEHPVQAVLDAQCARTARARVRASIGREERK
jgi:hypothetical protein